MTFAEKLAKLRRSQNYTQEQFADLLGVSRQSVSKWENGTAYPETEKLIKIGEMFDCSIDYLLKDSIEEPTPNLQPAPLPETKPKKRRWAIAAVAAAALAITVAILVIIFIPRRATVTIRSTYCSDDGNEYEITYKEIGSTLTHPSPASEYNNNIYGSWDLNHRGYSSAFGVVEVKNLGKNVIGSNVFIFGAFDRLCLYDSSSGTWRIFTADSCTDNAPMTLKVLIDKGKGEYYKYFVR